MVNIPTRDQLKAKPAKIDLLAQRRAVTAASTSTPTPRAAADVSSADAGAQGHSCHGGTAATAPPVPADATRLFGPGGAYGSEPLPPRAQAPAASLPPDAAGSGAGGAAAITPTAASSGKEILVSRRQEGNPVLKCISNVPWRFDASIAADYVLGPSTVCLFLSLRFHLLHRKYILSRLEGLQGRFTLCVVLVFVDADDHQAPIVELTRALLPNRATVVLAWSPLEAARYLETFKAYQSKPADMLQARAFGASGGYDHAAAAHACLTSVRSVNKADVLTLSTHLGSMRRILLADEEDLSLCPGLGSKKVSVLTAAFTEPFHTTSRVAAGQRLEVAPSASLAIGSVRVTAGSGAGSGSGGQVAQRMPPPQPASVQLPTVEPPPDTGPPVTVPVTVPGAPADPAPHPIPPADSDSPALSTDRLLL